MEISKNVTWKTLGEKVVAVKVDTGEYYTLNEVASVIWKAIDEGNSIQHEMVMQMIGLIKMSSNHNLIPITP